MHIEFLKAGGAQSWGKTARRLAAAGALGAALSGCAASGSMQEPQQAGPQAASAYPAPPASVGSMSDEGDALAELNRAENELAMLLTNPIQAAEPIFSQAPGSASEEKEAGRRDTDRAPPSPPQSPALGAGEPEASGGTYPAHACALACRALGSMQRAAERLCELAGGESERCDSAKKRVEAAEARVEPVCSDCGS